MKPQYQEVRSYRGVWFSAALVLAGFLIDVGFGGARAHLIGWIIAFVIIVGFNLLVVYAARSEKSLRVTADAVHVGEQHVERRHIAGLAAEQGTGAPVLGWVSGLPRGTKAVPLRLVDGTDVIVPSRRPDSFVAALGLSAAAAARPAEQEVRAATRDDLAGLAEIDERADTVFRLAGYQLPELPFAPLQAGPAAAVFVVGQPPVGFVWLDEVDALAHVTEMAVLPHWMRQGIGTRLLDHACRWAAERGYRAVTLTTFAEVPWNAPFYARHGFTGLREPADLTPGLVAIRAQEAAVGLDAAGRRLAMRRELPGSAQRPAVSSDRDTVPGPHG